ncbi:MAG: hypothetical protein GY777_25085 [Candidatus Brocadiaceae bacterium]|nr:hypothetical protein [Candidatus Brocadiaceae bacterium]
MKIRCTTFFYVLLTIAALVCFLVLQEKIDAGVGGTLPKLGRELLEKTGKNTDVIVRETGEKVGRNADVITKESDRLAREHVEKAATKQEECIATKIQKEQKELQDAAIKQKEELKRLRAANEAKNVKTTGQNTDKITTAQNIDKENTNVAQQLNQEAGTLAKNEENLLKQRSETPNPKAKDEIGAAIDKNKKMQGEVSERAKKATAAETKAKETKITEGKNAEKTDIGQNKTRVNKVIPAPEASGPHTVFKKDNTGRVNGYTEFDVQGNPVKRFRGTGGTHGGQNPPLILEPKSGKGSGSPPKISRPPTTKELPKGY